MLDLKGFDKMRKLTRFLNRHRQLEKYKFEVKISNEFSRENDRGEIYTFGNSSNDNRLILDIYDQFIIISKPPLDPKPLIIPEPVRSIEDAIITGLKKQFKIE